MFFVYVIIHGEHSQVACILSLLPLDIKSYVLLEKHLNHLVMDFFSIWAKRLSGEAALCMGKGA